MAFSVRYSFVTLQRSLNDASLFSKVKSTVSILDTSSPLKSVTAMLILSFLTLTPTKYPAEGFSP